MVFETGELIDSETHEMNQIFNYLDSFATSKNVTKDNVKELQNILNRELVHIEPGDSVYGSFRSFDKPLKLDGNFGPETKKYLHHFASKVSGAHSDDSATELIKSIENNLSRIPIESKIMDTLKGL